MFHAFVQTLRQHRVLRARSTLRTYKCQGWARGRSPQEVLTWSHMVQGVKLMQEWLNTTAARVTVVSLDIERHVALTHAHPNALQIRATDVAGTVLRTADGTAGANGDFVPIRGSWGAYSAPRIVSCTADGSGGTLNGYDDGDRIIVRFDKATNRPELNRIALPSVAEFNHGAVGWGVSGVWIANDTLALVVLVSGWYRVRWSKLRGFRVVTHGTTRAGV